MDVPKERYETILKEISSPDSPVGIDARHTHVIILHKLLEIERRLAALEEKLETGAENQPREPIH